jgi:hypothetical protein
MTRATVGFVLAGLLLAAATSSTHAGGKDDGYKKLFNGKDFKGWSQFVDPKKTVKPDEVWSVENGEIHCKGQVNGYLLTDKEYSDYVLKVEWKWGAEGPKKGPRNSGVFVHVTGADKIWPKGIEAQLMEGNAGDFWLVDNFGLTVDPKRQDPKVARHYYRMIKDDVEKPIGEWNQYKITCQGGKVKLEINGKLVNEGSDAEVTKGKILLQSEGAEIFFRNVMLKALAKSDGKKTDIAEKKEPKKDDKATVKFQSLDEYYAAADKAFKDGKAVIVLVGFSNMKLEKDLAEHALIRVSKFPGVGRMGIVVGVPNQKWLTRYDLPPNVNVESIRQLLQRREKQQDKKEKKEKN